MTGRLFAQQPFCYTTEEQNAWFSAHPELKARFDVLQEEAAALDREMFRHGYQEPAEISRKAAAAPATHTIPVVFHILHTGGSENISDGQVKDAVKILNQDFCLLNTDTSDVVADFKNKIGDAKIAFVLASKDPAGNCTNGIIRHWDEKTVWSNSFSNYKYTWPRQNYLNIYVVRKIGSGAAGYTYLPGSGVNAKADAIVILSTYVGSLGTGSKGTSRALTHEVGHWLNLPHTWGGTNQPGVACGDDGVSDTPVTKGFTSCNLGHADVCTPGVNENMQNYMDYAYCQRMFTAGQAARMQVALSSAVAFRNNLSSPANLALTGVTNPVANCAPKLDITAKGNFTVCAGKSLSMTSFTSNGEPSSYQWSASNGAQVANAQDPNTTVSFPNSGTTTITCIAKNSFGDATSSVVVTVLDDKPEILHGHMEGFENPQTTLPQGWSINNSSGQGWKITNASASEGAKSMYVAGEYMPGDAVAILESPSFDFKSNPQARFSFKYAYRLENAETKDRFIVQASNDCGGTWQDVYYPAVTQLAQNSGGVSASLFIPTEAQWKLYDQLVEHPNFYPFKNASNVRLRFYFQSDVDGDGYRNRFYLDEINFDAPVGVNELTRQTDFNVYPNPASGAVHIKFNLSDERVVKYDLYDIAGMPVLSEEAAAYQPGTHEITCNAEGKLAPGIYFLNLVLDGTTMSRKIIIR